MKIGDLIRKKHYGNHQKVRMQLFDPTYDPNAFYHVIEVCPQLGLLKIINTETGVIETVPDAHEYYEIISE